LAVLVYIDLYQNLLPFTLT